MRKKVRISDYKKTIVGPGDEDLNNKWRKYAPSHSNCKFYVLESGKILQVLGDRFTRRKAWILNKEEYDNLICTERLFYERRELHIHTSSQYWRALSSESSDYLSDPSLCIEQLCKLLQLEDSDLNFSLASIKVIDKASYFPHEHSFYELSYYVEPLTWYLAYVTKHISKKPIERGGQGPYIELVAGKSRSRVFPLHVVMAATATCKSISVYREFKQELFRARKMQSSA